MSDAGVRRIRGRMVCNPTDLSIPYPYGGLDLGVVRDGRLRFNQVTAYETSEEWGGRPVDTVVVERQPMFVAVMAEWSNVGAVAMLAGTTIDATTRRAVHAQSEDGVTRTGSTNSLDCVLLVVPDSPQDQALLMYRAMPHVSKQAEAAWSDAKEWGIPMVWVSGMDIQRRDFMLAPLGGLVL